MLIPPGLERCAICGEYNGTTRAKYLDWSGTAAPPDGEKEISVTCLCKGILCSRCKTNKIHRPTSNSYDPETNSIWHHAYFMAAAPCAECRAREQAPWN